MDAPTDTATNTNTTMNILTTIITTITTPPKNKSLNAKKFQAEILNMAWMLNIVTNAKVTPIMLKYQLIRDKKITKAITIKTSSARTFQPQFPSIIMPSPAV